VPEDSSRAKSGTKDLPWFPKHVKDWLESEFVESLDDASYRCYDLLLCHQWKRDGLPEDVVLLAKFCGKDIRTFRKVWEKLGPMFPKGADGRLRNDRLQSERDRQVEKRQTLGQNRFGKGKKRNSNHEEMNNFSGSFDETNEDSNDVRNENHSRERIEIYKNTITQYLPGRQGQTTLLNGGPPESGTGPIAVILRDDDGRQEWVSQSGEHWIRVNGVCDSRGDYQPRVAA